MRRFGWQVVIVVVVFFIVVIATAVVGYLLTRRFVNN